MLTLTPMATAAVRKLVADMETDAVGGLRIAPGEPEGDEPELSLRIVDAPDETDRTVETDGVHVFWSRRWSIGSTTCCSTRRSTPA